MPQMTFRLPIQGIHKGGGVAQSPLLTSGHMNNIRVRDTLENKVRVGQRPGLDKWGDGDLLGLIDSSPIVAICSVSYVE